MDNTNIIDKVANDVEYIKSCLLQEIKDKDNEIKLQTQALEEMKKDIADIKYHLMKSISHSTERNEELFENYLNLRKQLEEYMSGYLILRNILNNLSKEALNIKYEELFEKLDKMEYTFKL